MYFHQNLMHLRGLYLNKAGKEILISKYNEEIEKKIQYKGRKIELQNIIQYDCHNIANKILKEGDWFVSLGSIRYFE